MTIGEIEKNRRDLTQSPLYLKQLILFEIYECKENSYQAFDQYKILGLFNFLERAVFRQDSPNSVI